MRNIFWGSMLVAVVMEMPGMSCGAAMLGVPYKDWWKPHRGWEALAGETWVLEAPPLEPPVWAAHYVDIAPKPAIRKGKLHLFVTTPALCCFVRNVAGELADVQMQKPARDYSFRNISWSSGRNDAEMFRSDVVVWNGQGIDDWVERQERMMGPARRVVKWGGRAEFQSEPAPLPSHPAENATGNYVKVVQRIPVKIVFDEPVSGWVDASPAGPLLRTVNRVYSVSIGVSSAAESGTTVEMRPQDMTFVMASDGIAAREHMVPWEFFTLAPGRETAPGGRAPEGRNSYVWLDPVLAIRQVETIRDGLIRADPLHRALYIGKANAYVRRLRALDAEARSRIAGLSRKRLLGVGDDFAYFLSRYGIEQTGVYYPDIGGELFSRNVVGYFRQLMDVRPSNGIIIARNGLADASRRAFADLGLPVAELDPMETGDGALDYYERVTKANLDALSVALK